MIKSKEDLRYYLQMDKIALDVKKARPSLFGDDIWKYEILLRKREFYTNCENEKKIYKIMKQIYKFLHYYKGRKLGYSIPCNTFREGLRINHYGYLVVSPFARIGKFCDIHQGVNIGQNIEEGKAPIIGDNVFIAPGTKIFGNITIADNIAISANSVVNKNFLESNITIGGMPAKKIKNVGNPFTK